MTEFEIYLRDKFNNVFNLGHMVDVSYCHDHTTHFRLSIMPMYHHVYTPFIFEDIPVYIYKWNGTKFVRKE